jgi:hypothetical protein
MSFKSNQRSTSLGTTRKFDILRPEGFPKGVKGLVFLTQIDDGFGSFKRLVIRTDAPSGKWRIDRPTCGKLFESGPGLDGLYNSAHLAAQALVRVYP